MRRIASRIVRRIARIASRIVRRIASRNTRRIASKIAKKKHLEILNGGQHKITQLSNYWHFLDEKKK